MDAVGPQFAHGGMDKAMARCRAQAGEGGGYETHAVVAPLPGTGMAGVEMGVVGHFDLQRRQRGKAVPQPGGGGGAHAGRTLRKGFTATAP